MSSPPSQPPHATAHLRASRQPQPIITVLRCDDVPEPDRSRHGDTHERTARHVEVVASTLGWQPILRTVDVRAGEIPADDDDSDLYVTTGSATDPDSTEPWVVAFRAWLTVALTERGARIYGICFGHQLAAYALGGEVGRAAAWEVGAVETMRTVRLRSAGATQPDGGCERRDDLPTVRLLQSHQDEVRSLPPGAIHWLQTSQCSLAGYVWHHPTGGAIVGVQGHPEFDAAQVRDLYARRRERLGEERWAAADRSAQLHHDGLGVSVEALRWLLGDRFSSDPPGATETR